jgi:hypothetical protein
MVALFVVSLCEPSVASASSQYLSLPSFGPVVTPGDVAVDQSDGNVYVAALNENTIYRFIPKATSEYEVAGKFTGSSGTPSETPQGSFAMHANPPEPAPVAVDSSDGDIYVADPGHFVVDKFNSEDKYVCQMSGFGRGCLPDPEVELGNGSTFGELTGVAVDSHGNVYVSDYSNGVVDEFTAAGADVKRIVGCGITQPSGVAVDSNGILYVQNYAADVVTVPCSSSPTVLDPTGSFDVAVDQETNDVYVDSGSSVAVYGPSPANMLFDTFPVKSENDGSGIAIYGHGKRVFVSDSAESKVLDFERVTVPDVRLPIMAPTEVTAEEATLHGEIDPEETSEAKFYYEYGPTSTGSLSMTSEVEVGGVNGYIPATFRLTNLLPNTEYSYRLVGTNKSGLIEKSKSGTFTTSAAEPKVAAAEITNLTATSATFDGEVNPENTLPTRYHFEYEAEGCDERSECVTRLTPVSIGASTSPVLVSQGLPENTELAPDTTYRFRLVAENPSGVVSEAQTFITPAEFIPPGGPPVANTGSAASISLNGATVTGVIIPDGLLTLYEFEFGTTTSYGTVVLGGEAGSGHGEVSVAQAFGDLLPGVTYHYRVVAFNVDGVVAGADQIFTTSSPPTGTAQPVTLPILSTPVFPVVKYHVVKKMQHAKPKKKHHKKPKVRAKGSKPRRR